ncbi:g3631 [Coccomyxa elongata]
MTDPLVKTKVTHLMRCSSLADLAAAACSMDVMRVWGRWAKADGVIGKSYLPKSPLAALSATGVLAGFGPDLMTTHAFGRGTVAVPVAWIDTVAPGGRRVLQAVRSHNQSGAGKADHSGMHEVESILYLAETFWQSSPFMLQRYGLSWWALQLPAVRAIVGSYDYHVFEQEVSLVR